MRKSLLDKLAQKGQTFTVDEALELSEVKRESLRVILSRLEEKGWIERIEKGKYMLIPVGSEKGKYTLDEFVLASTLVEPYCVGYWSALNYHGFTEQIPTTVFVQTTSRKRWRERKIFGVNFKIVKLKKEKFFGKETLWSGDEQVNITDKEKTIVDCLDKPKYCGGIIEVAKGFESEDYDNGKILDYIDRIGNTGVRRRFGYLCDLYDVNIDIPTVDTKNYLKLDPTMPDKGDKSSKWRLIVNVDENELKA
ncbi:MAG: type IV toxin-antitoxin system AbiEi family antitoxin domain-containing protein [Candidatus Natronoplasma sp.]